LRANATCLNDAFSGKACTVLIARSVCSPSEDSPADSVTTSSSLFFIPDIEKTIAGLAIGGKDGFAPPIKTAAQARKLTKAIELKDY